MKTRYENALEEDLRGMKRRVYWLCLLVFVESVWIAIDALLNHL